MRLKTVWRSWFVLCVALSTESTSYGVENPQNVPPAYSSVNAKSRSFRMLFKKMPKGPTANEASTAHVSKVPNDKTPPIEVAENATQTLQAAFFKSRDLSEGVSFWGKDGRRINKQDVESFSAWGKDLREVSSVVVVVQQDGRGVTAVDGLKDALKIDNYKKSLLSNTEGRWHLGEWSQNDAVTLYVVERHAYSDDEVYAADLGKILKGGFFATLPDEPIIFERVGNHYPPWNRKQISARDVYRIKQELLEDKEFAEKSRGAYDAAKNLKSVGNSVIQKEEDVIKQETKSQMVGKSVMPKMQSQKSESGLCGCESIGHPVTKKGDSQVGVRGWCHCWADSNGRGLNLVGLGDWSGDMVGNTGLGVNRGDYSYYLCDLCGKCFTARERGDERDPDMQDLHVVEKYTGSNIPDYKYTDLLRSAQDRLLTIPDGGVVIPGKCVCKSPELLKVGLSSPKQFYVCSFCGRVYVGLIKK